MTEGRCDVDGCNNPPRRGRKLCGGHRNQKSRRQKLSPVGVDRLPHLIKINSEGLEVRESTDYPGFHVRSDGRIIGPSGNLPNPFLDKYGYQRVNRWFDGRFKQIGVHRIVCSAWHGSSPEAAHAAHINGDASDNRPENLRWSTAVENERDKTVHGTDGVGSRNAASKLTEEQVSFIKQELSSGVSGAKLSRMFNVSETTISYIKQGRTWTHV